MIKQVNYYWTQTKFDFEKGQLYAECAGIWYAINGPHMRRVLSQSVASLDRVEFSTLSCGSSHFGPDSVANYAAGERLKPLCITCGGECNPAYSLTRCVQCQTMTNCRKPNSR